MSNVFVECNPDEVLAKSLGITRKSLTHNNDKGRVCNSLETKATFSIGMIDEDPNSAQPTYLGKLELHVEKYGVKILLDKKRKNKLIILRPRLEEWIIAQAKVSNLKLKKFGLKEDPKELHQLFAGKAIKLGPLVQELVNKGNMGVLFLQKHLNNPGEY